MLLATVGIVAFRPQGWFQQGFPAAASKAVGLAASRDRSLGIFSDVRYADWLLWEHPELGRRVAYDARFELLSPKQLLSLYLWQNQITGHWQDAARGDRLIVVDRRSDRQPEGELMKQAGTRRLYQDSDIAVLLRPND